MEVSKIDVAKLNSKQEKFVANFAKTANATEAYKKAGYKVKSDETARVNAARLLQNANIQARLKELTAEVVASAKQAEIADVAECQKILTQIARNEETYAKDRVAALNTLLKAQGAFSQNVNIIGSVPVVFADEDKIAD